MSIYNLKQHVNIQTHRQGNTLDWIMSKENSTTISGIDEGDYFSDHCGHNMDPQSRETTNGEDNSYKEGSEIHK